MKSDVSILALRVSVHVLCSDSSFHLTSFPFPHAFWIKIAALEPQPPTTSPTPQISMLSLKLKRKVETMETDSEESSFARISASQGRFINGAEARGEIAGAFNLYKSSLYSPATSSWGRSFSNNNGRGIGRATVAGPQYCCYSLLETLPLPEPTWSNTPPSILAAPSIVATPPPLEPTDFEWEESFAASCTWWLGFLKSLDGKRSEEPKRPFEENVVMRNTGVFGHHQDGPMPGETPCLDVNDQGLYLDEWLMTPTEDVFEVMNQGENVVGC